MRRAARSIAGALALGLAAYPVALAGPSPTVTALGVLGSVAGLVAALGAPAVGAGPAAALLAAEYASALVVRDAGIDAGAPIYAVGWFLFMELVDLARAAAGPSAPEKGVLLGRAGSVLGGAVLGGAAAVVVLVAGASFSGGGALVLLAGALAAGVALGAVVRSAAAAVRRVER